MNYYPFHLGDYAAHTAHLEPMEDLAYRRMLDAYYLREMPLPADTAEVARLIRMRQNMVEVESVLLEFFFLTDDGWNHVRCNEEIERMQAKKEQQATKNEHESDRMRRYRERRSEMFEALRQVQVVPAWDVPMKELQRLFDAHCNAPATHLQREQVVSCDAPATAIPTPTPTPTPTPENKPTPTPPLQGRAEKFDPLALPLPECVSASAWAEWVNYRRGRRLTCSEPTMVKQLRFLTEASTRGNPPDGLIDAAIRNGWQGLFEPKPAVRGNPEPVRRQARQVYQ